MSFDNDRYPESLLWDSAIKVIKDLLDEEYAGHHPWEYDIRELQLALPQLKMEVNFLEETLHLHFTSSEEELIFRLKYLL